MTLHEHAVAAEIPDGIFGSMKEAAEYLGEPEPESDICSRVSFNARLMARLRYEYASAMLQEAKLYGL